MSKQLDPVEPAELLEGAKPGLVQPTLSRRVLELLTDLGVEHAYGLVGGAIAPFADALGNSGIRTLAFRHEGGAAFAAIETSLATGRPVLLYVTTGPGILNATNALVAARHEGAKVIVVSGATSPARAGRGAAQETSDLALGGVRLLDDRLFDIAVTLHDPAMLLSVGRRMAERLMRPGHTLVHLQIPVNTQTADGGPRVVLPHQLSRTPSSMEAGVVANLMAEDQAVIWLGFGARRATNEVRALAERTGALVMCTPRAKGIFSERHPQFIGVTGLAGHDDIGRILRERQVVYALVLGSKLGEASTSWDDALIPERGLFHVDLDPTVFGAGFPHLPCVGIQSEISAFLTDVLYELDEGRPVQPAREQGLPPPPRIAYRSEGRVRPQALMQAVQDVVIDGIDGIVLAEAGNSFTWATHFLRFSTPRYRKSGRWGSMGHMTAGVVGAAIGYREPAFALVGDGAMLMSNEISTAVAYSVPAVWIVLNDSSYGITDKGMSAQGFSPLETRLPQTDFAAWARALGADGRVVEHERQLEEALRDSVMMRRPFVIDVRIDVDVMPPIMRRIASLDFLGGAGEDG